MNHLRSIRHPSTHHPSLLHLPICPALKNSFSPFNPFSSSSPNSCPSTTSTNRNSTLDRSRLHRHLFSSCSQSHSTLLQSGADQPSPGLLDPSQYHFHSDQATLDQLAAALDARLAAEPDRMPELPDLAALKPPRLQRYLPGMHRQWYVDRVERVRRRLLRSFSRPQLEHVCRILGFTQAEERGLSALGLQRLGALRLAHPDLPVKHLSALVLAEQNPAFEAPVKRRDPSDGAYSKTDLVGFIMFDHWALTDPALIPAEQDFQALVTDFQATSRLFQLPYHELFLLYIDQARDPTGNQLGYLSRRTNVTLELVHEQEPASSTGLLVRGTMKEREEFWSLFEKLRRPISKHHIPLPADLGRVIHVTDAAKVLMCLAERAGCYLELGEMKDNQRVLLAYSFDKERLSSRVLDALTQYKILSEELANAPVVMSANPSARAPALVPFVPSTKPPWFINCRATSFDRLAYPVSRTPVEHPAVLLSGLVGVRRHLDHWMSFDNTLQNDHQLKLDDFQSSDEKVNVNAYFGHFVRPRRLPPSTPQATTQTKFFQEFLVPFDEGESQLLTEEHHNNNNNDDDDEVLGVRNGGLGGRARMIGGGEWVNEFVFVPASHSLGRVTRLSDTNNYKSNSFEDDTCDEVESSSHPISSLEEAEGGPEVYESASASVTVEVFKRPTLASEDASRRGEWEESYEVRRCEEGTMGVEKVWRRLAVVMLPSHPMDILLERERRTALSASAVAPLIEADGAALCVDGVRYVRVARHALQIVPLGRVGRRGAVVAQELRRTGKGSGEDERWNESRITLKNDDDDESQVEMLIETAILLAGR